MLAPSLRSVLEIWYLPKPSWISEFLLQIERSNVGPQSPLCVGDLVVVVAEVFLWLQPLLHLHLVTLSVQVQQFHLGIQNITITSNTILVDYLTFGLKVSQIDTKWDFFRSVHQRARQNVLKSYLKKSRNCPILCHGEIPHKSYGADKK